MHFQWPSKGRWSLARAKLAWFMLELRHTVMSGAKYCVK